YSRVGAGLAAALEGALSSTAGGFNRSAANRPTPLGNVLVMHPFSMIGKIVLLLPVRFSGFASAWLQPFDLGEVLFLLSVAQFMQPALYPFLDLLLWIQGTA